MNIQEIIKTIKTNESIGLSEKDITDFEKEINWHFPTDYRAVSYTHLTLPTTERV